jgi:hypothetical protein
MLRNRKDIEEIHLKGVMLTEAADETKLLLGVCELLQNIVPEGVDSWQKKRGVRILNDNVA